MAAAAAAEPTLAELLRDVDPDALRDPRINTGNIDAVYVPEAQAELENLRRICIHKATRSVASLLDDSRERGMLEFESKRGRLERDNPRVVLPPTVTKLMHEYAPILLRFLRVRQCVYGISNDLTNFPVNGDLIPISLTQEEVEAYYATESSYQRLELRTVKAASERVKVMREPTTPHQILLQRTIVEGLDSDERMEVAFNDHVCRYLFAKRREWDAAADILLRDLRANTNSVIHDPFPDRNVTTGVYFKGHHLKMVLIVVKIPASTEFYVMGPHMSPVRVQHDSPLLEDVHRDAYNQVPSRIILREHSDRSTVYDQSLPWLGPGEHYTAAAILHAFPENIMEIGFPQDKKYWAFVEWASTHSRYQDIRPDFFEWYRTHTKKASLTGATALAIHDMDPDTRLRVEQTLLPHLRLPTHEVWLDTTFTKMQP